MLTPLIHSIPTQPQAHTRLIAVMVRLLSMCSPVAADGIGAALGGRLRPVEPATLLQVLLVVILGQVVVTSIGQLSHHLLALVRPPCTVLLACGQHRVDLRDLGRGRCALLRIVHKDAAPVLRAAVVALAVGGGWVHLLKEHIKQLVKGDLLGLVRHLYRLRVARRTAAHRVVRGVGLVPADVADSGLDHAGHALVGQLKTPEAAASKRGQLQARGRLLWCQLAALGGAEHAAKQAHGAHLPTSNRAAT
mmetsp:Transcript_16976/g.42501  ORF Transcript_16976/g.42501 Transcript_16976/m.42501 type:complete len:249 (+) Transcript_16976:64-810(+)